MNSALNLVPRAKSGLRLALNQSTQHRMLCSRQNKNNEKGMVLLITVFIVSLATILVFELVQVLTFNFRFTRGFTESIQGNYMLKSSLNLARLLVELPKLDGGNEDWLGEPWALIKAAPSLPIEGFIGTPRLMITDEDGKMDINAILSPQELKGLPEIAGSTAGTPGSAPQISDFWKKTLRELFLAAGFQAEKLEAKDFKALGDSTYQPGTQVAIIADWMDQDKKSFSPTGLDGTGIESGADPTWFYNRPFKTLSELLLVPGMSAERLARVAPYIRVSPVQLGIRRQVNVNTAPLELLVAMGFPESTAVEMVKQRLSAPLTNESLSTILEGLNEIRPNVKVRSSEFGIYVRVEMPNITKWLFAVVSVRRSFNERATSLELIEIY